MGDVYENPDLRRERQSCHFNKEEITNLIDGGVEKTKERRELGKKMFPYCNIFVLINLCDSNKQFCFIEEFILSDPELKDPVPMEYLSHEEKYSAELRKACLLFTKLTDPSKG